MDEPKNKPADRLEKLLRIWGAEQAVAQEDADLGPVPVPRALRRPLLAALPWLTGRRVLAGAAIAAGLLLGGIGLGFILNADQSGRNIVAASRPDDPLPRLRQANVKLAGDLDQTQKDLARVDQARLRLVDQKEQLDAIVKEQARQLAVFKADLAPRVERAERATTQFGEQIAQLKSEQGRSAVLLGERQLQVDQLAGKLRAERPALLVQFQLAYLGGATTLAARQQSARHNRLVDRYGDVRKAIKDDGAGKLADLLEIWLTRLDQADTSRAESASDLIRQGSQADLPAKIEQLLAAANQPPEVRTWLLECELIFLHLDAAG